MLSVVIPTFNRREKVRSAVESVIAQSREAFEIIVVDDGSTDGTAEALQAEFGDRIRLIEQTNAGVSAARNRGVQEATGEWIAFLDSDDVWLPGKLKAQVEAIAESPQVGLVCTDWAWSHRPGSGCVPAASFQSFQAGIRADQRLAGLVRMGGHGLWLPTWMVRRDLIHAAGGFDSSFRIAEDTKLLFELARSTDILLIPTVYAIRSGDVDDAKLSTNNDAYSLELAGYTLQILNDLGHWCHGRRLPKTTKAVRRLRSYFLWRSAVLLAAAGQHHMARASAFRSLIASRGAGRPLRSLSTIVSPRLVQCLHIECNARRSREAGRKEMV